MSSHEPFPQCPESADAAPYVLGALEQDESFREHLATCAVCQAQVAELQEVADTLPAAVPPAVASEALRQRVLAVVRSEAQLLRAAGHQADRPSRPPSRWRSIRGPHVIAGLAIAASVAAAVVILTGGSHPSARVTSAQIAASVRGTQAALRQSGDRGELVVTGMPQPALGRIYEVWLNRTGSPQPTDSLFSVTGTGDASVGVPASLHGVKELLVTSEPLGGSSHPTSPPLIRVVLPA